MLLIAVTAIHVIVCFFLIIVVLLQHGKSADIAGAFGGMGSQTAFGPRGAASALSRATSAAVVVFMITAFTLTVLTKRSGGPGTSVLEGTKQEQTQPAPTNPVNSAPATPAPQTPQK
jgi:preprotein translocase subunit SecG